MRWMLETVKTHDVTANDQLKDATIFLHMSRSLNSPEIDTQRSGACYWGMTIMTEHFRRTWHAAAAVFPMNNTDESIGQCLEDQVAADTLFEPETTLMKEIHRQQHVPLSEQEVVNVTRLTNYAVAALVMAAQAFESQMESITTWEALQSLDMASECAAFDAPITSDRRRFWLVFPDLNQKERACSWNTRTSHNLRVLCESGNHVAKTLPNSEHTTEDIQDDKELLDLTHRRASEIVEAVVHREPEDLDDAMIEALPTPFHIFVL